MERAKIVLACLEGKRNDAVGREFGVRPNRVGLRRKRFAATGLAGLRDRARPGKTRKYGAALRRRVLRQLELPPPKGWPVGMGLLWRPRRVPRTMRSGACCAGKASNCAAGARGASAPTRNLPPSLPLAQTGAADIIGLYLNPPENALVLSVDEKPTIGAGAAPAELS